MAGKKKISFEDSLSRLNEIVRELEKGDLPLSDSLSLYEESTQLIRSCTQMLDEAEQKVTLLKVNSDGSSEEVPFDE